LGLRSNQLDKARERLEKALILEPNNQRAVCLLGDVLEQMGDMYAEKYQKQCELLTNKK
jgi:Flp pilus assembly protein TadD